MRTLLIGEVADRTGLAVSALRYYDRLGLLGNVPRHAGVRRFPVTALRRVALIRAAREAGFTLATRRLPELDALIHRLTRLRETVADCLACGCLSLTTCAMLGASTTRGE